MSIDYRQFIAVVNVMDIEHSNMCERNKFEYIFDSK